MKIYEFHATTGYSGLSIPVRGIYVSQKGYDVLSKKAFEIYRQKIQKDPSLAKYDMRFIIWERESDKDGIFRLISTTFRDYGLEDGDFVLRAEHIKRNEHKEQ